MTCQFKVVWEHLVLPNLDSVSYCFAVTDCTSGIVILEVATRKHPHFTQSVGKSVSGPGAQVVLPVN